MSNILILELKNTIYIYIIMKFLIKFIFYTLLIQKLDLNRILTQESLHYFN